MNDVTLDELRRFQRAVHYGKSWKSVQQLKECVMELTKQDKEYMAAVEANTPDGYHMVCGWPDEANGITWDAYTEWAKDLIDELTEGDDIGSFQTFQEWKEMKRAEMQDEDDLGFSHYECDLCRSGLAGNRYKASAIKVDGAESNFKYYTYSTCTDCILYIANGELPER